MLTHNQKYQREETRQLSILFPASLRTALHAYAHRVAAEKRQTIDHADVLIACVCRTLELEAPSQQSEIVLSAFDELGVSHD
jgi:hypothetical protein